MATGDDNGLPTGVTPCTCVPVQGSAPHRCSLRTHSLPAIPGPGVVSWFTGAADGEPRMPSPAAARPRRASRGLPHGRAATAGLRPPGRDRRAPTPGRDRWVTTAGPRAPSPSAVALTRRSSPATPRPSPHLVALTRRSSPATPRPSPPRVAVRWPPHVCRLTSVASHLSPHICHPTSVTPHLSPHICHPHLSPHIRPACRAGCRTETRPSPHACHPTPGRPQSPHARPALAPTSGHTLLRRPDAGATPAPGSSGCTHPPAPAAPGAPAGPIPPGPAPRVLSCLEASARGCRLPSAVRGGGGPGPPTVTGEILGPDGAGPTGWSTGGPRGRPPSSGGLPTPTSAPGPRP